MIYYNSYDIFNNPHHADLLEKVPGGREFTTLFKMFSQNITFLDRTNVISVPFNMTTPDFLKMPTMDMFNHKSFEEICDDRARELLDHAAKTNRTITVMYSGGVDSTLILCSFLKTATPEELKNIVVLLSEKSIFENPVFYRNFVIKYFKCDSSYKFPAYMGNDKILFITGENADQLFGSQVTNGFATYSGYDSLFAPVEQVEGKLIDFFVESVPPFYRSYVAPAFHILKRVTDAAPIKIDNLYKFLWWINFAMKWQSVYVRIIPYSWSRGNIKFEENYTTFYSPVQFQLWSMHNSDKLVGDSPDSFKYVQKKYILDVNGDTGYLKKLKMGSLSSMVQKKENCFFIDNNMKYHDTFPTEEYYNYNNDFVGMLK
jgi:hypothetical protein